MCVVLTTYSLIANATQLLPLFKQHISTHVCQLQANQTPKRQCPLIFVNTEI